MPRIQFGIEQLDLAIAKSDMVAEAAVTDDPDEDDDIANPMFEDGIADSEEDEDEDRE